MRGAGAGAGAGALTTPQRRHDTVTGLTFKVEQGKLVIVADLKGQGIPSKSGKSEILATTHGNQTLLVDGEPITVGVNVYKKI